jgi:hypothetical protein
MQKVPQSEAAVVTVGLPESGKTTFLAALWHLIFSAERETVLRLKEVRSTGELGHLNAIAERWRAARQQDRTSITRPRFVDMSLLAEDGTPVRLVFPDIAGEAYRQIWEDRECDHEIGDMLTGDSGILLFIHADMIRFPTWISDNLSALAHDAEASEGEAETQSWHPSMAPTQVKIVDLLSVIQDGSDQDAPPRRLAVMFSAWDKVEVEEMKPARFLATKLPLLDQYLRQNAGRWDVRVYGISAQGGEYDAVEVDRTAEARALLNLDSPSARIRLVHDTTTSHDLTEPVAWLMT